MSVALHSPASAPVSIAPDGTVYPIPAREQQLAALADAARRAEAHRREGGTVVVVQGLGFVGAAVAATIAGARNGDAPTHFVLGVDLPTPNAYWKVARLNEGRLLFEAADPELERLTRDGVADANLVATTCDEAYALADVIVVDVHLDVVNRTVADSSEIEVELEGFEAALRAVGRRMRPDALVLVETTVPIGTCERIVRPVLEEERRTRGIRGPLRLAHAYERVMPGRRYVDSIRRYPRSYAGIDQESALRTRAFLSTFVDAPLWELRDTVSTELAKVLENSYRAMNIAFMQEWALLAERIGVDLFDVVDSIRVRNGTHDNMRYPGFGVGGYCITKDALLGQWGAINLLESESELGMTLASLTTNYAMPRHTLDLVLELAGGTVEGKTIAVCGVSYLADLSDSRNSPTELLVDELEERGAIVRVHDPHLVRWDERPDVDLSLELDEALNGVDGVVFAVPHTLYLDLNARQIVKAVAGDAFLVDAHDVASDELAAGLYEHGWRVAGVGKGHWRSSGYGRT